MLRAAAFPDTGDIKFKPLGANSSLGEHISFTWNGKVGPKGHSFAPQQRDFSQNNPSQGLRQHGLLFSAHGVIYKQKEKVVKILAFGKHAHKRKYGARSSGAINQLQ